MRFLVFGVDSHFQTFHYKPMWQNSIKTIYKGNRIEMTILLSLYQMQTASFHLLPFRMRKCSNCIQFLLHFQNVLSLGKQILIFHKLKMTSLKPIIILLSNWIFDFYALFLEEKLTCEIEIHLSKFILIRICVSTSLRGFFF